MRSIIHEPTGLDDPFLPLPGKERSPRDPLEDQAVLLAFVTSPSQTGQRAWVEVKTAHRKYSVRAQLQYSVADEAFWHARIDPERSGTEICYRIFSGRGKHDCISSRSYGYVVKKWVDATSSLNYENGVIIPGETRSTAIPGLRRARMLTDGDDIFDLEVVFDKLPDEHFYGLGEHFDSIELPHAQERFVHVFDQYKVQRERGYAPVPFLFSNKGRGFFVDTGFMTSYRIDEETLTTRIHTKGQPLSNTVIHTWNQDVPLDTIKRMYSISKPISPPLWAFGPWISANEWNSQEKVLRALECSVTMDLPVTALVIEAWSDEQSFYIFNGAQNSPVAGDKSLSLGDFEFRDPWPNPVSMVEKLHERGVRLLLWQIPVLENVDNPTPQHVKDVEYAKEKGFLVTRKDGSYYTVPKGRWFEGSVVTDLMKEGAAEWWASKRRYLFNELGIDGLKTDGGEHLWGRETIAGGRSAAETRNLFQEAYFKAAKSVVGKNGVLFSRSGYSRSPASTIFWVGDEDSTWEALRSSITAGLNVSISGNPCWGWDIAGFSGELPSPELYKRSVELAVFTPIFQIHSEDPADPEPSSERTPWNMAERFKDESIIDHYRRYVSLRMSVSSYIYEESQHALTQKIPLTLPLFLIDARNDPELLAYLLGRNMLVVPAVDEHPEERLIFLPPGEWTNIWSAVSFMESVTVRGDKTEVYLRKDSLIPLSVPSSGHLLDANWSQQANGLLFVSDRSTIDGQILEEAQTRGINLLGTISGARDKIIEIDWKETNGG